MDAVSEPIGYMVVSDSGDRIHFLDWGGAVGPGVVLVHGLAASAWAWTPVARRLAAAGADDRDGPPRPRPVRRADGDRGLRRSASWADDVVAVAEGSGALDDGSVVLVGHGFGAIVAAAAAARLGDRCARLVLVDGGLADVADGDRPGRRRVPAGPRGAARGDAIDVRLPRGTGRSWDPATWDADQERAARAAVVETPAGRLVSATRPHALEACVRTMFAYRPAAVLPRVTAEVVVVRRTTPGDEDETGVGDGRAGRRAGVVDVAAPGHNLLRYRPDEVTAAILGG